MLFSCSVFPAVHFPFRRLFRYLFDCFKLLFKLFQIAFSADCFSSVFFSADYFDFFYTDICGLFLQALSRIYIISKFIERIYDINISDKNIHSIDKIFTFCIIPSQNIHILNYFAFKHSYLRCFFIVTDFPHTKKGRCPLPSISSECRFSLEFTFFASTLKLH